jgi:predicted nucleic acid-binding protein
LAESFLLDTSVLSELAPGRRPLPPRVASWLAAREARFHIATMTLAEISEGIAQLRRSGAERRADEYRRWVADIIDRFDYRLLPLDIESAWTAGEMADAATASGVHPGLADIVIAAIAKRREFTVLTRNLKHFVPLDVPCVDPFKAAE